MLPNFDHALTCGPHEALGASCYAGVCEACGNEVYGQTVDAWRCSVCGVTGSEDCRNRRLDEGTPRKDICAECLKRKE